MLQISFGNFLVNFSGVFLMTNKTIGIFAAILSVVVFFTWYSNNISQAQSPLTYTFDPTWPKTLPNNWKMGGVTGLAVDHNDNVWVYNRPNDLTSIELHAEVDDLTGNRPQPLALCCVRPVSYTHLTLPTKA